MIYNEENPTVKKLNNKNNAFIGNYLCTIILLTLINNGIINSAALQLLIYIIECIFIWKLYLKTQKQSISAFNNKKWLTIYFLLVINIVASPYEPIYANILKFAGYALCFSYGAIFIKRKWEIKFSPQVLIGLIIIPFLLVALFDHTIRQNLFFINSNNYVYYGLSCALLYYTIYFKEKSAFYKSFAILLCYILSASSVGVIAAIFISIVFINRKNITLLISILTICIVSFILALSSDIEVFARIKNMLTLISSLSLKDWLSIEDINLYDLQESADLISISRDDNTSFIWRVQHWVILLKDFFTYWYYSFFFGLFDGYSTNQHSLPPHNDVLRILIEYGFIVFYFIVKWVYKAYCILKKNKVIYLILPIMLYHFTENLIDNFPANSIIYFCCGFWYYKISELQNIHKNEKKILTPNISSNE